MRWGLMGGTFDPIHLAHLRGAQEILEHCGLDRVVFIPSASPPLKHGPGITPYEHRERMVRLAVEGNPAFAYSDVENRREGRSYTVDTIGYFRETFGEELEIFFILGQDAFLDIRRWKDWRRLLTLCHFVVMSRPGGHPDLVCAGHGAGHRGDGHPRAGEVGPLHPLPRPGRGQGVYRDARAVQGMKTPD